MGRGSRNGLFCGGDLGNLKSDPGGTWLQFYLQVLLPLTCMISTKFVESGRPEAQSTQDARAQIRMQTLWCCLRAVWTPPFTSTGPICLRCACSSCVDEAWASRPPHPLHPLDGNGEGRWVSGCVDWECGPILEILIALGPIHTGRDARSEAN